jgi:hypothetical protein
MKVTFRMVLFIAFLVYKKVCEKEKKPVKRIIWLNSKITNQTVFSILECTVDIICSFSLFLFSYY